MSSICCSPLRKVDGWYPVCIRTGGSMTCRECIIELRMFDKINYETYKNAIIDLEGN